MVNDRFDDDGFDDDGFDDDDDNGLIFGDIRDIVAEGEHIRISAHRYVGLAFDRDDPYVEYLLTNVPEEDRTVSKLAMLHRTSDHYHCRLVRIGSDDEASGDAHESSPRHRLRLDFRFDATQALSVLCDAIVGTPRYYTPAELSEIFARLSERIRQNRDTDPAFLQNSLDAIRAHGIVVSADADGYHFEARDDRSS